MTDSRDAEAPPAAPATDSSLLCRLQGGNAEAATLLYFRYAEQLTALAETNLSPVLAARVSPEDIVQSVFRTFFRRVALGQYEVPGGEDLWKLFLVIALNKIRRAAEHHRAARRDVRRTPQGAADAEPEKGRDENALTVLRLVLEELLAPLPPSHRAIVERRVEGWEVAEIAEAVGRSKRSVERVLHEFRQRLLGVLDVRG